VIQFRDVKTVSKDRGVTWTRDLSSSHRHRCRSVLRADRSAILHQNVASAKDVPRRTGKKTVPRRPATGGRHEAGTMWIYRPMRELKEGAITRSETGLRPIAGGHCPT